MLDFVFQGTTGSYSNVLTVSLNSEMPTINAAPAAVWFNASVTGTAAQGPASGEVYDPKYHEVIYHWDFDDPANARPTTALNIPERWKNQNEGRGRRVAHVFNDHGSYTVKCYAYEPATQRFGSQTITVEVGDPDVVFAGNQTIVFDPAGDTDISAHPGAQRFTTMDACITARKAIPSLPARILMANDATWTVPQVGDGVSTGGINMRFDALDPAGVKPNLISERRIGTGGIGAIIRDRTSECSELSFNNLNILGDWDSTTETGTVGRPFQIDKTGSPVSSHIFMLHRCFVSGFELVRGAIAMPSTSTPGYQITSDTFVTNWQDFGVFAGLGDDIMYNAIVGSSIAQDVDALSGGAKNDLYNNHGPLRDSGSDHTYLSVVDMFSRNGWSLGGTLETINGDDIRATAVQATIRVNTSGIPGIEFYADRVMSEGNISLEVEASANYPGSNIVFDRILQLVNRRDAIFGAVVARHGGSTFRNLTTIILNLPLYTDTVQIGSQFYVREVTGSSEPTNDPAGFRAANCTLIDLRNDANTATLVSIEEPSGASFTSITDELNLMHRPALSGSTPVAGETINLADILDGVVPRDKGPRYGFLHQSGTLGSDVADGASFDVPYSQITDMRYNHERHDYGTATDQAYWLVNAATDTRHRVTVAGNLRHASRGEMLVSFGAAAVSITNNTGSTWASGSSWVLQLDRSTRLRDTPYDPVYDATSQDLNVTINATDPNTTAAAPLSALVYDDDRGTERRESNNKWGAQI